MKRLLPFCLLVFVNLQTFAQNPELFQTWYLTSYSYDLGDTYFIDDIQPSISPYITIDNSLAFSGEGACSGYLGQFNYDSGQDVFILESFDATLNLCDYESHNEFENNYFGFFNPMQEFNYEVYTDSNTDESFLTLSPYPGFDLVYQNFPLSISENKMAQVKVYPTPVKDQLFIVSEKKEPLQLNVYSMSGKKILNKKSVDEDLDVSSLSKGMYLLEIISAEDKTVQKFIKE